jgi:membrane protease YdiL (CAAX protease family)
MAITTRLRRILADKRVIRPWWRFALFVALYVACGPLFDWFLPKIHFPDRAMDWFSLLMNEALDFALASVFTLILCRIERSRFSSFGLRARRDSARLFGQGILWGVVPSMVILIPIWMAGACSFHGWALAPAPLLGFAALWALAFLAVGFAEEFTFRGYALQTLGKGIGFWPAAAVMSGLFGFIHFLKPDDGWIDPISVALYGIFWCFTVRRTGSLWFGIGFHAASDYTDIVVFAEPNTGNAGQPVRGHLLNVQFHGPAWLTGGPRGTEGSLLVFAILAALFFLFHKAYPKKPAPEYELTAR